MQLYRLAFSSQVSSFLPQPTQQDSHKALCFFSGFGVPLVSIARLLCAALQPSASSEQIASIQIRKQEDTSGQCILYLENLDPSWLFPSQAIYIACHYAYYNSKTQELDKGLLERFESFAQSFESIDLLAWSYGVRAASTLASYCPHFAQKLAFSAAIAGTIECIHNDYGIAENEYKLMLRRFGPKLHTMFLANCLKFTQGAVEFNVVSSKQHLILQSILSTTESYSYEELTQELACVPACPLATESLIYQQSHITRYDSIFSQASQERAWQAYAARYQAQKTGYGYACLVSDEAHIPLLVLRELFAQLC